MATLPEWIEARVIQKIATEAEWNEITLVPYKGEVCLVGDSGGKVVNIKVGDGVNPFADLNYMFDSIQQNAQYVPITSNALPTPVADPAWGMVTGGTYTFGGVDVFTVPVGHWGIANYSSGTWSLVDIGELPMNPVTNVVEEGNHTAVDSDGVWEYVQPIMNLTEASSNIINPLNIVRGGYRLTDGSIADSDNIIRSLPITLSTEERKISIYGVGGVAAAQARFAFFDINGGFISAIRQDVDVDIPIGAYSVGITIANESNIAIPDPVNNPYKDTMMVIYGSEPIPYEPYRLYIDPDSIKGIQPEIQEEFDNINVRLSSLEEAVDFEYKFPVGQSIDGVFDLTLSDTGDYIEFEARIEDITSNNQLRMFGTPNNTSSNVFGIMYYDFRLRGNVTNEPWIIFDNMPSFADYHKYKLQVNGSNWDFYIDGVLHQSKPKTSNLRLMTIGAAYTQSLPFWLKNQVSISVGGNVSVFKNFNQYNPNIEKSSISKVDLTRSNVYVTYQPTGHIGRRKLTVFILRESTGKYIGIDIINQYEPSKKADLYRIYKGDEYEFDGNDMTPTGKEIIAQGESEFTTQIVGKSGHFGGAHGHEIFDIFKIFINGKEKSLDEGFSLVPADSFYYIQKSNIVDDNELSTPLMEHYKRTDFSMGAYKTFNRVKCLVNPSLNMQYVYSGIVCLSINGEDTATDDYFNSVPVGQSNSTSLVKTGDKMINYYSVLPGVQITSRSIRPEDSTLNTKMWNQNRLSDGLYKYYRVNNDNVQGNIVFNNNEVWEVECEVLFK